MSWQGSLEDGAVWGGLGRDPTGWAFSASQLSGVLFVDTVIGSSLAYH